MVSAATVHRWLQKLGISRLRDLDVTGNSHRTVRPILTTHPGQMIHVDVKKIGAIPDGGGWRIHGRGSDQDRAARRQRPGYSYWHTAIDGHTRLAFTESLPDEKGETAAGFSTRAAVFSPPTASPPSTASSPTNGSCYRSWRFSEALPAGAEHRRTRPFHPQTNGKVERYNRILGAR